MNGWMAIVNRHSGGSAARSRLPLILKDLSDLVDKIVFTEYAGHATELAMDASSFRGLAVVGGDGTLFEILKGLDRKRQRIAIIPAGRGNSLARDLGLLGTRPSLDAIDGNGPQHIDLMEVTFKNAAGVQVQQSCASTVGLGYPAAITKAAGGFPRHLGELSYAAAAAFVRPVPFGVEISRGEGNPKKTRLKLFIASNTRHVANFDVFPSASCRDGFMDLLELDAGFLAQNVHNLSGLFGSTLFRRKHSSRAKRVELLLQEPQELMIDGEIIPEVISVSIRILPMALECIHRGIIT